MFSRKEERHIRGASYIEPSKKIVCQTCGNCKGRGGNVICNVAPIYVKKISSNGWCMLWTKRDKTKRLVGNPK